MAPKHKVGTAIAAKRAETIGTSAQSRVLTRVITKVSRYARVVSGTASTSSFMTPEVIFGRVAVRRCVTPLTIINNPVAKTIPVMALSVAARLEPRISPVIVA